MCDRLCGDPLDGRFGECQHLTRNGDGSLESDHIPDIRCIIIISTSATVLSRHRSHFVLRDPLNQGQEGYNIPNLPRLIMSGTGISR